MVYCKSAIKQAKCESNGKSIYNLSLDYDWDGIINLKGVNAMRVESYSDKDKDTTFVVFRGSTTPADWIYDLSAKWHNSKHKWFSGYKFHEGFIKIFDESFEDVSKNIAPNKYIIFTGHSLGGVIAQLFHAYYLLSTPIDQKDKEFILHRFNSPNALSDSFARQVINVKHKSFTLDVNLLEDSVHRFPGDAYHYSNLEILFSLDSNMGLCFELDGATKGTIGEKLLKNGLLESVSTLKESHIMETVYRKLISHMNLLGHKVENDWGSFMKCELTNFDYSPWLNQLRDAFNKPLPKQYTNPSMLGFNHGYKLMN